MRLWWKHASLGVGALVVLSLGVTMRTAGVADATPGLHLTASVNGRSIAASSQAHPVRLDPKKLLPLEVVITNGTGTPQTIHTVRLSGEAVGLTFFAYDTSVDLTVDPGAAETIDLAIDVSTLKGQATGLMSGSVAALDASRHELASESVVTDTRGSLWSVYGLFGLVIAILTASGLAGVMIGLARQTLSPNRALRAVRFIWPGVGVAMVGIFTLSAVRVWVPSTAHAVALVLVCAVSSFGVGWLTPTPESEGDPEEEEEASPDEELVAP